MGDAKKECIRCVKEKDPSPLARSWKEYFLRCELLAKAVANEAKEAANLRAYALHSPEALCQIERGLFTMKS